MGIHNIWRLLDYFAEPTNGEAWRGKTIAIDASVWLSQMVATTAKRRSLQKSAAERLLASEGAGGLGGGNGWGQLSDEDVSSVLEGFLDRIIRLLWLDITPVFVFDGPAPDAKLKEQAKRRKQRARSDELKLVSAAGIVVEAQVASIDGGSGDLHTKVQRLVRERHSAVSKHHAAVLRDATAGPSLEDFRRIKVLSKRVLEAQKKQIAAPIPTTMEMSSTSSANVSRFIAEEGHRVGTVQRSRTLQASNHLQASISSSSTLFLGTSSALAASSALLANPQPTSSSNLTADVANDGVEVEVVAQAQPGRPTAQLRGVTSHLVPLTKRQRCSSTFDSEGDVEGDAEVISVGESTVEMGSSVDSSSEIEVVGDTTASSSSSVVLGWQQPSDGLNYVEAISLSDETSVASVGAHQPPMETASSWIDRDFLRQVDDAVCRQDARHNTSSLAFSSSTLYLQNSSYGLVGDAKDGSVDCTFSKDAVASTLRDVLSLLRLCGAPFVLSPAEADAQCAYLCDAGLVDAVFTEDSDVVAHGASVVLRGFFATGTASKPAAPVRAYRRSRLAAAGLVPFNLQVLAILLGCDYCAGIPRVGVTRALQILAAYTLAPLAHDEPVSAVAFETLAPVSRILDGHPPRVEDDGRWCLLQSPVLQRSIATEIVRLRDADSGITLLSPDVFAALFHPPIAKLDTRIRGKWQFVRGEVSWDGLRHFAIIRDVSPVTIDRLGQLRHALANRAKASPSSSSSVAVFAATPSLEASSAHRLVGDGGVGANVIPDECHFKQELSTLITVSRPRVHNAATVSS